ncbi:hypothetical protein SK128_020807 [Halocaridina rubra]|uniref:Uncharacterized protein n=1 Tax=Halocaridina rubra TaxID=373956 RepID=A0AAN8WWJ3_HALRR
MEKMTFCLAALEHFEYTNAMESELTCDICSDVYLEGKKEPVTLPECGHTFCRQCLLNIEKAGSLSCPYCRTKHHGSSVTQLSTVYAILNLTKFLRRSKFGVCESHTATLDFWCWTCGKGLCGFCLYEGHMIKEHQIVIMKTAMDDTRDEVQKAGQHHLEDINNKKKHLLKELHNNLARLCNFCENAKSLSTFVTDIEEIMEEAGNSLNMEHLKNAAGKIEEYTAILGKEFEGKNDPLHLVAPNQRIHKQMLTTATNENSEADITNHMTSRESDVNTSSRVQEYNDYENDDSQDTSFEYDAAAHTNSPTNNARRQELTTGNHLSDSNISFPLIPVIERSLSREEALNNFETSEDSQNIAHAGSIGLNNYTSQIHGNDLTDSEEGSDTVSINSWLKWSVKSCDGREGRLRWEDGQLHLYTLNSEHQDVHANMKFSVIESLLPNSPEVFLDFGADGVCFGRVYIRIWGELRRAQHFFALCIGSLGPSYKGSRCSKVEGKDKPGECLRINHYITTGGTVQARGLMNGLEWSGEYSAVKKEGLVVAASGGKCEYDGCFDICTRGNPAKKFSCPFGEVISGMAVVKIATCHEPIGDVTIMNTGVVVSDQAN